MKYLYKQTGMIVESSIALDSAIFKPLKETPLNENEKEEKPQKRLRQEGRRCSNGLCNM